MPVVLDARLPLPRRFRRLPHGGARASQPSFLHLHHVSNASVRFGSICSALRRRARRLLWPRLTPRSALQRRPFGHEARSPRVRRVTFTPFACRIYARRIRVTSGFGYFGPLALQRPPRMRFVFLRPELCLQLPPHPPSRRRGCCSARGSCYQGPQRTCTSSSSTGRLSPPGYQRPSRRCAPCLAHQRKTAARLL